MNLCHCFTNFYLVSSLSLLSVVVWDNPTLAVDKISELAAYERILATDSKLSLEISSTAKNVEDAIEKIPQSERSGVEEASICSFSDAIAKRASQCKQNTKEWEHLAPLCERSGLFGRTTNLQKWDAPIAKITSCPEEEAAELIPTATLETALEDIPQGQTLTLEGPVTPVSQLKDVQPSDWAFQALQFLSDRYSVITGYPDGTFRGNRAMTRYEFAAALNQTLERLNALIAQGSTSPVSRDDLATLQRLTEEFTAELATLRSRVDGLEARTDKLEVNQFSTTTKLTGQVIFALTGGGFSGDSLRDSSASRIIDVTGREIATKNPNTTFIYRAALDLNTSFSGTDLLKIRLDIGSNGPNDNAAGFLEPTLGSVLDFSAKPPVEKFGLSRLYYTFSPSKDLTLSLGPRISLTDYVGLNSYANLSFLDFSTQALINNYILFPVQGLGAGAVVTWNPGKGAFTVLAAYMASSANEPGSVDSSFVPGIFPLGYILYPNGRSNRGLFGDPHQGVVELQYAPSKAFALRLQYAGGNVLDGRFDVFGVNFELALSEQIAFFGRYGYGKYEDTAFGDITPSSWMAGIAFPDLFVSGAKSGIAVGQPFIASELGNATQTNFEAFYNFPVSNNIRITPLVQIIVNPANQEDNGTIFTGTLRTVFSF